MFDQPAASYPLHHRQPSSYAILGNSTSYLFYAYSWTEWARCGSSIVLAAIIVIKKEYAKNIKIIEKSLPHQIYPPPPTMFKKGIIKHIHAV
jgi:hypothetical protein